MTDHAITESQSYQSIGELSPEAEHTLTAQKGWDGLAAPAPSAELPIAQLQGRDVSFWNRRANAQTLATTDDMNFAANFYSPVEHEADIPPIAGYAPGDGSYRQTPTAATEPSSFAADVP